jgi:hypothetical protein
MNLPPNIIDIRLNPINGDAREFEVTVRAEDPENDVLTYMYKVSRGRIVGSGSKVYWDLGGEKPGTYTITTAADDGVGPRGRFISKTVVVN